MRAIRPTLVSCMLLPAVIAALSATCAMSHPSARERAHYPAINLAAPLPYNLVAIHTSNVTGDVTLLAIRERIEETVADCLSRRGIHSVQNHTATDEDEIRWKPSRELDEAAAVALGKGLTVRGVLVIDLLELRSADSAPTGVNDGIALDARLVDRNAAAVVWARKDGAIALPTVWRGAKKVFLAPTSEDVSFNTSVCQMLETLTVRGA